MNAHNLPHVKCLHMHCHMYVVIVVLVSHVAEVHSSLHEHTNASALAAIISSRVGNILIQKLN